MIHQRTVLVLGAGASKPYGFPTGPDLITTILKGLGHNKSDFRRALLSTGAKDGDLDLFRRALEEMQFDSIDLFLEHQPDHRDIGKLAIAAALIPCESRSALIRSPIPDQHWYRLLFHQLLTAQGFNASKLSVISLNYDRSFRQYLFDTLVRDLRMREDDAARSVLNIEFIYLHGDLGDLPWRPVREGEERRFTRAYSPEITPDTLTVAAKGILTVSEFSVASNVEFMYRVESCLREAEVVGFLGFGYHEPVMQRLKIAALSKNGKRAFLGSAYKLGRGRHEELRNDVRGLTLGGDEQHVYAFLESSGLIFQGRPQEQTSQQPT